MTDISDTLTPKSDQLDAVDLLDGPLDITVTRVDVRQSAEQPVVIHLAEFPRPWKPGKNMRRVLAACWGKNSDSWPGRRARVYCDPKVIFAGAEVGGVRISHLDIEEPTKVPLIISKGKSAMYPVGVLPKQQQPKLDPNAAKIAGLRAEWKTADDERKAAIQAEVERLQNTDEPGDA